MHFGLDVVAFVMFVVSLCRGDLIGLIYMAFLGLVLGLKRHRIANMWPLYLAVVSVLIMLQFLAALGYPPSMQLQFPWSSLSDNTLYALGIPSDRSRLRIAPDYVLLLFSSYQMLVFAKQRASEPMERFYLWT